MLAWRYCSASVLLIINLLTVRIFCLFVDEQEQFTFHFLSDHSQNLWNYDNDNSWQNQYSPQYEYQDSNIGLYSTQGYEAKSSPNENVPIYYAQDNQDYEEVHGGSETNIFEKLVGQYRKLGQRIIDRVGGVDRQALAFLGSPVSFQVFGIII